ncbi:YkvI family membrane protein [Anaerosolibacter sp.]|uniref:YkvI family membrane protein n=1 Tax=Anaerosolibacter sp. TaxID=1872527 RepID=UPI0039F049BC
MNNGNIIKIASIYMGTVIGAGFASGQEIMEFFTKYGLQGFYGVIIAAILFSLIGSIILLKVHKLRITSFEKLLQTTMGARLGQGIKSILFLLLLSGYCIMLAGSGALFQEQFDLPKILGVLSMTIVCFITFVFSISGLALLNTMVVPLLLVGIFAIGSIVTLQNGLTMSNGAGMVFSDMTGNWLTSSLLYVSYNSIGAIAVMSALLPLVKNKRTAVGGGILGGIGLGLMASFLLFPTLVFYTDLQGVEIPMMAIATRLGGNTKLGYGVLLWLAMLTTAVSNGFVFIEGIKDKLGIGQIWTALLFCIAAIPLASFGFKSLVHTLYPLFGYIGIFVVLIMLFQSISYRRE